MLADRIEQVIGDLALDGRVRGRSFVAFSPWAAHDKRSLYVDIARKAGAWIDFHTGETGDALNLEIDTLARYVARLAEAG